MDPGPLTEVELQVLTVASTYPLPVTNLNVFNRHCGVYVFPAAGLSSPQTKLSFKSVSAHFLFCKKIETVESEQDSFQHNNVPFANKLAHHALKLLSMYVALSSGTN